MLPLFTETLVEDVGRRVGRDRNSQPAWNEQALETIEGTADGDRP